MVDHRIENGARAPLPGFYRLWMVCVFGGFAIAGIWFGYSWGVGGSILCMILGLILGGMVMVLLNTPEKLEMAIYTTMAILFVIGLLFAIVYFWGWQPI